MTFDFKEFKSKITSAEEWLRDEFTKIRTGRASLSLLDPVRVDSYGALAPLNQVASIALEDARTIKISPWDKSVTPAIEKAIVDADLGVGVVADSSGIRVTFPELTEERRKDIAKVAKQKLEDAKITVRKARDDVWHEVQAEEKSGDLTEDEKFRAKDEMEKLTSEANKNFEELYEKKEKEVLGN